MAQPGTDLAQSRIVIRTLFHPTKIERLQHDYCRIVMTNFYWAILTIRRAQMVTGRDTKEIIRQVLNLTMQLCAVACV